MPVTSSNKRPAANKKRDAKAAQAKKTGAKKSNAEAPEQMIADLDAATARKAMIMSEIIGPPVSKRRRG